jgi:hypothetical protein
MVRASYRSAPLRYERERERERKRERRKKWGSSETHYIWCGGIRKKESIFTVLKVPRQCPLVLLVEAVYMIGTRFLSIFLNI